MGIDAELITWKAIEPFDGICIFLEQGLAVFALKAQVVDGEIQNGINFFKYKGKPTRFRLE